MKFVVLIVFGIAVCALASSQENEENAVLPADMRFLARALRDRLVSKRNICGTYKKECGLLLPCCPGYECHHEGGFSIGECNKNRK